LPPSNIPATGAPQLEYMYPMNTYTTNTQQQQQRGENTIHNKYLVHINNNQWLSGQVEC